MCIRDRVQIAVDDEHDTVRHREALPRRLNHDLAELAPCLAAQGVHAGRIHKNDLGILLGQDADDAVARRLRLGRDDRHLLAHKGVGKGGLCAYIAGILQHNGYKTGLFTSPHLDDITYRLQYSGSRLSVCFQYIRKVRGIFHLHPVKSGLHQAGNVVISFLR